ncbi:MAG: DUF559 domain-containing protein [Dehalococcoidia bacterium]|nr:DUF559 domain-containing protein [Dehalococcoidia bacterium]
MTKSERVFWAAVRGRQFLGLKWRRQHPVGAYVVDFYCEELRLAVELDGGVHRVPSQRDGDIARQAGIEEAGIRFIRISAEAVETDIEGALSRVAAHVLRIEGPAR